MALFEDKKRSVIICDKDCLVVCVANAFLEGLFTQCHDLMVPEDHVSVFYGR